MLLLKIVAALAIATTSIAWAQDAPPLTPREQMLLDKIDQLERRVAALEAKEQNDGAAVPHEAQNTAQVSAPPAPASPQMNAAQPQSATPAAGSSTSSGPSFPDGTTLNLLFDGYYGFNFNHPVGRVNLLRYNDVLSNSFTVDQAVVMFERSPDVSAHRRWGYRLDLMFGQDTESLQGNPLNEPRPQIYRNIFQAYGSYMFPIGSGLQLDFGKFASSFGVEGTYTKDQLNYSRSFLYTFLPAYHVGARLTYNVNSKVSAQYYFVNGLNQSEGFNGDKSQAVLLTVKPNSSVMWNANYFEGQQQRDVVAVNVPDSMPTMPTQPDLSVTPVTTPHNGREHIVDTFATINIGSKWSTAFAGDYAINRIAANSYPQLVYGGAAYLHRQMTSALALNGRFEYVVDDGGLFTGVSQDLKEVTGTAIYQFADGFQTRLEFRRDFSNRGFFLTSNPAVLSRDQTTATIALLWWFGGKQGSW
jgi:hypothetical protein